MMTVTDNNKKLSAELNRTIQHVSTVLQLLHTNVTQLRAEVRNRSFFTGVPTIRCVLISIDKTSRVFTTLKRYSGNQQYKVFFQSVHKNNYSFPQISSLVLKVYTKFYTKTVLSMRKACLLSKIKKSRLK